MIKAGLEWTPITRSYRRTDGTSIGGPVGMAAQIRDLREFAVPEAAISGMHRLAADMERAGQAFAPWTDRTGDAREGLAGMAGEVSGRWFASFAHTVDYGLFLERNPKFAIVSRILSIFGPKATQYVADELELELRGRGSKFRHRASGRFG